MSSRNIPTQAVLSSFSLNALLQLWHMLTPSAVHVAPDGGVPFGHKQTLASHLLWSPLTFHPVVQPDTWHPDEYEIACATSQTAHMYTQHVDTRTSQREI